MILQSYSLLKKIEQRPAMWTGENSLRSISNYITGYIHALLDHGIIREPASIDPFSNWVANKLGYYESTAGWVNMILAYSVGHNPKEINWDEFIELPISEEQHSESVKVFYRLVEQFKNEAENACA